MNFGNFGNLFEQLKNAQKNVGEIQENLAKKHVEASAGGGKVTAVMNGQQKLIKLKIDPEVVDPDPDEIALLEEMIVSAINQACEKSKNLMPEELGKMTGMSGMPNMQDIMKMFHK